MGVILIWYSVVQYSIHRGNINIMQASNPDKREPQGITSAHHTTCCLALLHYSVVYSVHCHCTLYNLHCTLYTVHCTVYTVHCTLYTVHCTLYTAPCKVFSSTTMPEAAGARGNFALLLTAGIQ